MPFFDLRSPAAGDFRDASFQGQETLRTDSHPAQPIPRSKLGAALLRLHRAMETSQQSEISAQALFQTWQQTWSRNRSQLSERLTVLNEILDSLLPSPPTFGIFQHDDTLPDKSSDRLPTEFAGSRQSDSIQAETATDDNLQSGSLPTPKFLFTRDRLPRRVNPEFR